VSGAGRQLIHEVKLLLRRWELESDLLQEEMIACLKDGVNEYYQEDIVDFDSEIDLGEDE
tara:strand:+ start:228 stop:407 length:180 start_codon:yes stop_codon:yes gene_type:complete